MNKAAGETSIPTRSHATYCRICEAACGLLVDSDANGRLIRIRPDRTHPLSRGFVCAKGVRFLEVANHPARLLSPLRRSPQGYQPVSWAEALTFFSARLRPIIERHGPHAVGIYYGTPLPFNYLGLIAVFSFVRALGTRNVFSAASQDCQNKFAAAQLVHGSPLIHPIPDFEHADFALLLGTNPYVSQGSFVHLEGGATLFDRLRQRGDRTAWVDPRRTESAQRWGEHIPIVPGTDIFLLLSLLDELRELYRPGPHEEGLASLLQLAADYPAARTSALTGIDPATVRRLANDIRTAHGATFHMSVGVNQGPFGSLCYVALQALAYLSGNFDRRGGLLFHPWAGLGADLMRRLGVAVQPGRSRVGNLPTVMETLPGGILADEILTPGPERIRALIVIGGDPVRSIPDGPRLRRALQSLDCLVCLDLFQNETGRTADLLLPTTSWLERWDIALLMATLHQAPMIQYAGPLRRPPGETRTEAHILADLSVAVGRPLFGSQRLTRLWRKLTWDAGLSALTDFVLSPARPFLGGGRGIPSPRPRAGSYLGHGPRTVGHRVRFWHDELEAERQRLDCYAREGEQRTASAENGVFLLLGRRRRLGHNSWLHGGVRDGEAEAGAWMAPADVERLGLSAGGAIILQTDQASLVLPVTPNDTVAAGTVVVPHGLPDANINDLIPSGAANLEPISGQHRLVGIPVRVMAAPPAAAHIDTA